MGIVASRHKDARSRRIIQNLGVLRCRISEPELLRRVFTTHSSCACHSSELQIAGLGYYGQQDASRKIARADESNTDLPSRGWLGPRICDLRASCLSRIRVGEYHPATITRTRPV